MYGVWLKPNNDVYVKYVRTAYFSRYYVVGYKNQYNHRLVALIAIHNGDVIKCNSFLDYMRITREHKKGSFKIRILTYIHKKISNYLKGV